MASEQTINTIAKALGEEDESPLAQIAAVIEILGEEQSLVLLSETEKIQGAGGLMRGDGSGKRTAGGVYFFLARQRMPKEVRSRIFNDKKPRPPGSVRPPSPPAARSSPPPASARRGPPPSFSGSGPGLRRRVFEVVPASKPPGAYSRSSEPPRLDPRTPWPPAIPPGAYVPPELPTAVMKAKAKQGAVQSLAVLDATDQYLILLELLADLHAQHGGEVPKSEVPVLNPPVAQPAPPPPPPPPSAPPPATLHSEPPAKSVKSVGKASKASATAAKSTRASSTKSSTTKTRSQRG